MQCCKIGCNQPVIQRQKVIFQNLAGLKIKTEIGRCSEHAIPNATLHEFDESEIANEVHHLAEKSNS